MYYAKSDLELMIGKGEKILWRGKPNKRGFILEGIFNIMLPLAIAWALIDSMCIASIIGEVASSQASIFIIAPLAFILVHMLPVWIYLSGVIFVFRRYKHTEYIITDKCVYISGGLFSYICYMKPFTELSKISIYRGIIDQLIGVGDVVLIDVNDIELAIEDIKDYRKIFELVKKLQEDIYTDTMYPNALRPSENTGFKTKYKGLD